METIDSLTAVPYELVIVPAKPSADMIAVGDNMIMQGGWAEEVYAEMLNAAPVQQSPAVAVPEFNGWYCAQCQCGVDPSEVTYRETHTTCGRYITDDEPPTSPQRVTEQDAYDIILSFYWFMESFKNKHGKHPSVVEWQDAEGRALLAKLNGAAE